MLENWKKISLTVEEGNALVTIASVFSLPEKLGPDNTYSVADRSIAIDEVRFLFRELRAHSPLMQTEERWQRFGPSEAWKEVREGNKVGHRLVDPKFMVNVKLDDDILSGIVWCLLVALHPSSPIVQPVPVQEDALWPIAKKISRVRVLREQIGITAKAQPKRWKSDQDYADTKEEEGEKPIFPVSTP